MRCVHSGLPRDFPMHNLLGDLNFMKMKLSLTEPRTAHLCSRRVPRQASTANPGSGVTHVKTIRVKQTVLLGVRINNKCENKTTITLCQCHIKYSRFSKLAAYCISWDLKKCMCRCPGACQRFLLCWFGLGSVSFRKTLIYNLCSIKYVI